MRQQLIDLIAACTELIERMQDTDEESREAALDTARGLLWKWVDEGNPTQLINLLAAIRLLSQQTLEYLEDDEDDPNR